MMTATWNGRIKAQGLSVAIALALAAVRLWLGGGQPTSADAQASSETPPVLPASELAPPDLLRGPTFVVDDPVPIQGMLGQFTVRSDVGTFEAHGRELLRIRVSELHALAQIEPMSKSEEFLKAAGNAVARPVESAANMLLNPIETVKGVSGGVARFFGRVELGAQMIAGAADGARAEQRPAGRGRYQAGGWHPRMCLATNRNAEPWPKAWG